MRFLLAASVALLALTSVEASGSNCAACVLVVGLVERIALVEQTTITNAVNNLCKNFKDNTTVFLCDTAMQLLVVPAIEADFKAGHSPDYTCKQGGAASLKMCEAYPQCTLYSTWPPVAPITKAASPDVPSDPRSSLFIVPQFLKKSVQSEKILTSMGVLPPIQGLGDVTKHQPFFDADNDSFSDFPELRGFHWRGKDCNDKEPLVYPGRARSNFNASVDHNCNGITGVDPSSGQTYEAKFCANSQAKGVIILGDSAAAHFRIPPQYFNPVGQNSTHTWDSLPELLLNEADWPQCSWATGFLNSSTGCPSSLLPFKSFYQRMVERNRCNHRDYQNIGVNGGSSDNMMPPNGIITALARNKTDNPAIVMFALIGNDVCNGHAGFDRMTTPAAFETNVLSSLKYLEERLAPGSTVIFIPLVDGRVLYNALHDKYHPAGVTYAQVYDYLNCLETSPCWGWMNGNATVRDLTTARAASLNLVYGKIVAEQSANFKSFNMFYKDFDWKKTFDDWAAAGNNLADLIEPTDGFHPSTTASMLIAENVWNLTMTEHPEVLGPVNPFNDEIVRLFGNQGGYGV